MVLHQCHASPDHQQMQNQYCGVIRDQPMSACLTWPLFFYSHYQHRAMRGQVDLKIFWGQVDLKIFYWTMTLFYHWPRYTDACLVTHIYRSHQDHFSKHWYISMVHHMLEQISVILKKKFCQQQLRLTDNLKNTCFTVINHELLM